MIKKSEPTKTGTVRLSLDCWAMLRYLMQHYGRGWLEKAIKAAYKKATNK